MQKCPSCPKCHSFYSTKDGRSYHKHPLLLDCGHTFCEGCLQALAKEGKTAVKCPVTSCLAPTPIQGDVKDLWPDLYTVGLVVYNQRTLLDRELSKITHSQMVQNLKRKDTERLEDPDKLCRECLRKAATCRCEKCDFIMCMQCFDKIHSASKMLKQHQPIPLSSDNSNMEGPMCKHHPDRPIEYYCEDDCIPICSRCVIMGDHKKHNITSMEEKNKAIFADMEPALHTGTKVLKKLRKAEHMMGTLVPDMKMETNSVIEEIRGHFQFLHGMLQAREKQLIDDVFTVYKTGIEPLATLKEQMYEDIRNLEVSIKAAQRILNNNNEVILNANDILSQLQAAKDLPCIVHKKKDKPSDKIRFEPGLSLPTAIVNYGGIDGSVPIMAEWHTISEMPEELMMDDCDTSESITPAESIASISDAATSDMNADDESNLKKSWSYLVSLEDELSAEDNKAKPIAPVTSSKKSKKEKSVSIPIPPKGRIKGGQDRVYVTHIKNPGKFFVQRCGDAAALRKLSRQINAACKKNSTGIPTDVIKGDLLLGKYTGDNEWYRVKVKQVLPGDNKNKMKLDVIYLDYGNVEVITIDRTRKMQPRFMEQPPFLMECCLSDIVPVDKDESWSLEAVQTFAKMTAEKPLIMIVISEVNNVLHIDLSKPPDDDIMDDRPISVRDTLVFLELANFITPASNNVVGMAAPKRRFLCATPVSTGTRFGANLTCANDPSNFYVQQIGEESSYFQAMMQQMQDQYNMERGDVWTVYCPRIGMICVARFLADDTWYRAQVLELPGNKMVTVQYVDYGNIETVDVSRLCKILDSFLVLPVQAQHCQLCDVAHTEYTQQAKRWWSDRVTMKEFSLKVTGVVEDCLSVVMYDDNSGGYSVNSELVSRGFATSTGSLSNQLPKGGVGGLMMSSEDSSTESQSDSLSKSLRVASSGTSSRSSTRSNSSHTTPVVSPKKALKKASQRSERAVRLLAKSETEMAVDGKSSTSSSSSTSPLKPVTESKITKVKPSGLSLDIKAAEERSKSSGEDAKSSEPDSPGNVQIIISHYQSPSDFHVQLASSATDGLDRMMQGLQEEYKDSETQWMSWKVSEFCVAKYSQDGRWYRGKIQKILHKNVMEVSVVFAEVKLVDYGYTCSVSQNQLRPLARFFLKDMAFAFHCHLAYLVPAGDGQKWSRTACEYMEDAVQGVNLYLKKEGDMENSSLAIDLFLEEHIAESALEPSKHRFVSLREKIVEQGLGIPTKRREVMTTPQEALEPTEIICQEPRDVSCVYYFPADVPNSSSIEGTPTYVDLEGVIYIQDNKNETTLKNLAKRLNRKFSDSKPHGFDVDWKKGQACAAKFHLDQLWYRAQVVQIEAEGIKVSFIDFGNSETVSPDQLRADVAEFIDLPQLCFECVLNNISPMTEDGQWPIPVLDQIHKLIVSKLCTVEIVKIEHNLQASVKLSPPGVIDLGDMLCYRGDTFHPDNTSELVTQSHKISKVIEKKNPYKITEMMPPGEYFPVIITHVEVPNVVYFQHTRQSGSEMDERMDEINVQLSKLEQLSVDLNELGPLAAALPNPKPGLMCFAQFGYDQCWYRAVVIERDPRMDLILVLYVDYGTSEYVTVDRVRALPSRFGSLPAQSVRMVLSEVTPKSHNGQWSREVLEAIMTSVCNKQLIACLKKTEPPTGDLYVMGSSAGASLTLAYQEVGDQGLVNLPDESKLYGDTMVTKDESEAVPDNTTPGSSDIEVKGTDKKEVKSEEEKDIDVGLVIKDTNEGVGQKDTDNEGVGQKDTDNEGVRHKDTDELVSRNDSDDRLKEEDVITQRQEETYQSETKHSDNENQDVCVEDTSDGEDDVIIEEDMSCDDIGDDDDKEGDK
ncbi:LOW QUALITY PROTEIN: RING finger protein 17-like [Pecten maximus]|uniref:LOW QUALITY PROTEIN: RING finger protein 17-like n=1 Tax=Pecten maximus TaxID=6579 RepID=UPI00145905EA|nr:LOW QUALITY PROTEIN: RING finger protein 17-like [Pecten maximus]